MGCALEHGERGVRGSGRPAAARRDALAPRARLPGEASTAAAQPGSGRRGAGSLAPQLLPILRLSRPWTTIRDHDGMEVGELIPVATREKEEGLGGGPGRDFSKMSQGFLKACHPFPSQK